MDGQGQGSCSCKGNILGDVWVSSWPHAAREGLKAAVSLQQCHWVSLGLKHTKISLICASLGPGSISIRFLSAGKSVPLRWGDKPVLTNPKGCFGQSFYPTAGLPWVLFVFLAQGLSSRCRCCLATWETDWGL